MNRTQKISVAVSGLVVAGLVALAAPTVASVATELTSWAPSPVRSPDTQNHTAESRPVPTAAAVDMPATAPDDACSNSARIHVGGMSAKVTGTLVDRGARDLAAGVVGLDDEGNVVSYTVAPGDAPYAIAERLCIEDAGSIATLNHTRTIHPDQLLRFDRDPDVLWVPYYNPVDAPAGFRQIPYQYAIEEMAWAADAGDVDAMRAIWADELSGMFTDQALIDVIAQALDTGDIDVLQQMFS
ncbi:hypothetical protein [Microbacterium aurantiacum]|uniref:hypothetical protein n=1 Tax=Microbacterium aurantiacum TaxID=162393 RepID=UPI000C805AE9|nr:hypothetical protein [Microbacterium aurantiacum]